MSRTFISPTRHPGLRELVNEGRHVDPLNPVLVKTNIPRVIAFNCKSGADYPGVHIDIAPLRTYPEQRPRRAFDWLSRRDFQRSISRLRKTRLSPK